MSILFLSALVNCDLGVRESCIRDCTLNGKMDGDSSEDDGLGFNEKSALDLGNGEGVSSSAIADEVVPDRMVTDVHNAVDAFNSPDVHVDGMKPATRLEMTNFQYSGSEGSDRVAERRDVGPSRGFERLCSAFVSSALSRGEGGPDYVNVLRQMEKSLLRAPSSMIETERFFLAHADRSQSRESHKSVCIGEANRGCDTMQHKRAKILEHSQECNYSAMTSSGSGMPASPLDAGQNLSHCMSVSTETEMHMFLNSPFDETRIHMGCGRAGGNDDEDENGCSKAEEYEVKMDLTDDLLHMVFSFLDHISLCSAARVCRQWRAASAHEDFWRRLDFRNLNIAPLQFADMCNRYPNVTEVDIFGTRAVETLAQKALNSLRSLEVLTLGRGHFGDAFFHALIDCPFLSNLDISESLLGNGIQEIPVCHDRLHHLSMTKCRVSRLSIRCPQLETLSLKRTNMTHAILSCPQLKELNIAFCNKLSDAGIRSIATSCTMLTSLDISNCSPVTDETLREIALACPNLHVLDASYCPNISLESVRLPLLTDLNLRNCEGINSGSMTSLSYCYMLEELQLDFCWILTSVSLDLPRLRSISLVHCRRFVDLNLRCPSLSSITICNCPVLNRITITSNALQKLVLQKQESLASVHLQCQVLQEVDLSECESLKNSICDVFSDGGGCPMLKSLVLDSCESLTKVGLRSTSLISLSLVGCRGMKSLELCCPNLQHVFLDGCDHLEDASFCPVGLTSLNLGICPKLVKLQLEAPQMTILELKGCGVLSQAAINCPNLISLDASFCSQLQDDCLSATTASCPYVESLILMSCPSVGADGLSSLCRLPNLTLLDLSYTFLTNLQPVFDSCTQLEVLKLQACKYLVNSSLDALHKRGALPALRELDLSYGSICQSAIEELLSSCTNLTHVSLNGCANMHDLDWSSGVDQCFQLKSADESLHLPNALGNDIETSEEHVQTSEEHVRLLQNLNCVGCPNIKKVVIPSSACCVHLSSLNLSLSANLKEVNLSCCNLSFLNLSNCCSLEILVLDCPRLTSLLLQSCGIEEKVLEDAISHCNMLETLDIRFCPKITGVGNIRLVCPSLKRLFSSLWP
ncbi:F-box/LRR-repeat protein 15-like isoform X1 [Nymphaea colorata]|nr:F-box/LRR-repeat protein 15-like isoform X1 [Nymphaea colorata]